MASHRYLSLEDIRSKAIEAEDKGHFAVAIVLLEKCLERQPVDGFGWLVLSDAYKAVSRLKDCRNALMHAIDYATKDNHWPVQMRLGMVAALQGLHEEAEKWFATALKHDEAQTHLWTWTIRAANLITLERFSGAEQLMRNAIESGIQDEEMDEAYHTLARALMAQGRYADAETAFRKTLRRAGDCENISPGLAAVDGFEAALDLIQSLPE